MQHCRVGDVGLAAVAEAQRAGAEIFATAGAEDKRTYLRSLGIVHVLNSRTLEYMVRKSWRAHKAGASTWC